jgi:hypothetical protein
MANLVASGYISAGTRTEGEVKTAFEDQRTFISQLVGGATETTLTLATDQITPVAGVHSVDTQGGAGTDNLANALQDNLPDGSFLLLRSVSAARLVVVKHSAGGAGQFSLQTLADFTLTKPTQWILFKRTGTLWEEIMRSASQTPTITAKGDLIAATAADVLTRLAVGADGLALTADSTQATGLGYDRHETFNYTFNGDMEIWGGGAAVAPTGWTATGAGITVAKNTTGGQFKIGAASAAVTRVGTDCYLAQAIDTIPGFGAVAWWQGRKVTLGCWVRATVASRARIGINDGVGSTFSPYHTGGSALEWLTVTRTLDAAATKVEIRLQVDTGNTTAQFDGAILVFGPAVLSDFNPSAWRGRKCVVNFGDILANVQAATYFYGPGTASAAAEITVSADVPFRCVARNLRYQTASNVGGAAQTAVATLRKNETTDTALTASIASGARRASDVANEVAYAAGDTIALKVVLSATTGSVISKAMIEIEEVPLA